MTDLDDTERAVIDAAEDARETDLELLCELVRAAPVNPPGEGGEEGRAADVLRPVLDDLGLDVTEYTAVKGRPNLVARLEGEGDGPTLLMNAHLDVVPVENPDVWPNEPFEPEVIDDKLYGRGTADHKAPMVGMLGAVRAIQAADVTLEGDLVFVFDSNEERGGEYGMNHIVEVADLNPDLAIYAVTSGLTPEAAEFFDVQRRDNVYRANVGHQQFRVTVTGDIQHTLAAGETDGATSRLLALLPHFESYVDDVTERTTPLVGHLHADVVGLDGGLREASVDVRRFVAPSEDPEAVTGSFKSRVREAAEAEGLADAVVVERVARTDSVEVPADHPLVRASVRVAEVTREREPTVAAVRAPTGMARIGPALDVPMVLFGFGNIDLHHAEPEWIAVEDIHDTVKAYALVCLDLLAD